MKSKWIVLSIVFAISVATSVFAQIEVGNKLCPISGESVDAMGDPIQHEYNGKIYNLCCKMCLKDFEKNPKKYSKMADEMVEEEEKQKEAAAVHGDHDHDH